MPEHNRPLLFSLLLPLLWVTLDEGVVGEEAVVGGS